jgi:hypothetical protein
MIEFIYIQLALSDGEKKTAKNLMSLKSISLLAYGDGDSAVL